MTEACLFLEKIRQPHYLRDYVKPLKKLKKRNYTVEAQNLVTKVNTKKWISRVQDQLMTSIIQLRYDIEFIKHLPKCKFCKATMELDVERYMGTHSTWYVCQENDDYLEKRYRSCPKARNYKLYSYWEKYQDYQKDKTWPDDETQKFILDRAKWAYKIIGKQIKLLRQMLQLVRNWDFTKQEQQETTLNTMDNKLAMEGYII